MMSSLLSLREYTISELLHDSIIVSVDDPIVNRLGNGLNHLNKESALRSIKELLSGFD